jgi:hypothetical protein
MQGRESDSSGVYVDDSLTGEYVARFAMIEEGLRPELQYS